MPFGESISSAYLDALKDTLTGRTFLQVTRVEYPTLNRNANTNPVFHRKFEEFRFPDGRTGRWWLEDRIKALLRSQGEYWKPMRRDGQWNYVLKTLKGIKAGSIPRWNSNRLVITLFDSSKDLHTSREPRPPCLLSLDFKPIQDELTLISTFRAQYTDAKGYGNLFSLALLLLQVSEATGFEPAHVYSVAHKAILKYPTKVGQSLLTVLDGTEK